MLGRIAEFVIFGFVPLILGIVAFPLEPLATEMTISGEVSYRERIALPPNAVLTVELADVSLADAPAAIIGKQEIDPAGQAPIQFTIGFDSSVIRPKTEYTLQARITVGDTLWFINDTRHTVDPASTERQKLTLRMVSKPQTPAPSSTIFDAIWVSEDASGAAMPPTFSVKADGQVFGKGPCNNYFGAAEIGDGTITIGNMGATSMACATDIMDRERSFFDALGKVASFEVQEGRLTFKDKDSKEILHFSQGT